MHPDSIADEKVRVVKTIFLCVTVTLLKNTLVSDFLALRLSALEVEGDLQTIIA